MPKIFFDKLVGTEDTDFNKGKQVILTFLRSKNLQPQETGENEYRLSGSLQRVNTELKSLPQVAAVSYGVDTVTITVCKP